MQVLLRNPLADPYILGVSGGAAVGALSLIAVGAAGSALPIGAFVGALRFHRCWSSAWPAADRSHAQTRLLLTGVVIAAGWGAVTALLLALSPDAQMRGMVFWLLGDLSAGGFAFLADDRRSASHWRSPCPAAPALNVLAQGELRARALGVPVVSLRRLLYFVASGSAAMAVASAGTIGFVGLLAPHLARLVLGNDQRVLLPGSALAGGALLTLADTVARSVIAPTQLPVGAVTALIGVPLFLYLLEPPMSDVLLDARALRVNIGGKTVCDGLDLAVGRGESWAILGLNGVGKTTLLHTLAGLRAPAAGDLRLRQRPLAEWPARELARVRGLMPQDTVDAFPLTVLEAALVGRYPHTPGWGLAKAPPICGWRGRR